MRVCPAGAIFPGDLQRSQEIEVGSVILAPGAELFNPQVLDTYGYGVYPNVVTSLEYERILSASGPTGGELVRPSDGKKTSQNRLDPVRRVQGSPGGICFILLQRVLHVRSQGGRRHQGAFP